MATTEGAAPAARMHVDEVDTDAALVRLLIAEQFPRWAGLPVERVASTGTSHAIYRLGPDMAVRLPLVNGGRGQVEKEQRWLPWLGARLPLSTPEPLAMGEPAHGYPWRWLVVRWLPGADAASVPPADPVQAAEALGGFVRAMRALDAEDGPPPGPHNFHRGVPLARRDDATRAALAAAAHLVDARAAAEAWEDALSAPPGDGPPCWFHGDLLPGNLLVDGGRLTGVVDFGGMGVGDPACDLLPAWSLLPTGEARDRFRDVIGVDEAAWRRGRGWALSVAAIAVPYYEHTNPAFASLARRMVAEVVADREAAG